MAEKPQNGTPGNGKSSNGKSQNSGMKKYTLRIKRFLEKISRGEKVDLSRSFIKTTHAADLAEIIANLTSEETQVDTFVDFLPEEYKARVFSELPEEIQEEVLQKIGKEPVIKLFKALPPDEAVDLLSMLPPEDQEALLQTLPADQQGKFRRLLVYGKDSAGGIMTTMLVSARSEQTVADVIKMLRQFKDKSEMLINIFVVDAQDKLLGTVPLQTFVVSDPETLVSSIMTPDPITVSIHDDQEVVAHTVTKYNLMNIPVVDDSGRLLGRITTDDVMEVWQEEADEDVLLMAGMDTEELRVNSSLLIARLRLPWLLLCLCGSFLSGSVISAYRGSLDAKVILAFLIFLPAICAMGGNSGLQTCTVTIRNLAYGQVFYTSMRRMVRRELLAGIAIGIVTGTVVGSVAGLWLGNVFYGTIIGLCMMFTVCLSTCTGFFIPIIFNKIGIDPAVASGPLITTLNDVSSTLIYLSVAVILLRLFF